MRSAYWRGMALPILCLTIAACSKPDARSIAADPNSPAVVKLPPPVLPGDTVRKAVEPVVTPEIARMTLGHDYALLAGGFAFVDENLLAGAYSPTAELITPNGSFVGRAAILKEFHSFGMDGSVKDFKRTSVALKIVDSTVADSGTYVVVRKRAGADSTVERGLYASVWRIHPAPMDWVMTRDHLYQATRKKAK